MVDDLIEARLGGQRRRIDAVNLLVVVGLVVGLLVALGRVVQIQVAPESALAGHVQGRITSRGEPARRGDVLDRRGRLIGATRSGQRLFVDPSSFGEPTGEKLAAISAVTGVPMAEVAERVITRLGWNREREAEGRTLIQYVSIGGALDDHQRAMAAGLGIEGVHLERCDVREVLADGSLARLVGKVGTEGRGLVGVERTLDEQLLERDGALDYVRDALGRPLWVEADGYRRSRAGASARLSVDLVVQSLVREELLRGLEEADAAGGRAVVLDPVTGEILAMVDEMREVPGAEAFSSEAWREAHRQGRRVRWRVLEPDPLRGIDPALGRNRCVEDVYEPGSTFKPFMWAAATERGYASPEDEIETNKGLWRTEYGRAIEDVVPLEKQSWHDVLVNSSNIGMTKVTSRMTHGEMRSDVLRFGFGRRTGVGLAGESPGLVTGARSWSKYTQTSVSFGYEIGVTPLQMVLGFSAFARTGVLAGTLPRLTLEADASSLDPGVTLERVVSGRVAERAREAMEGVGAKLLDRYPRWHPGDPAFAYSLFGKSGTAKIPRPDGRGYFDRQYVSSFIAGAPVGEPRIVVLVVIDDPGPAVRDANRHFGSQVAGPVVVRVARRTLEYLGEVREVGGEGLALAR